jgi:5-methyltetrahydropteroyltriglutamate--homocysteine methyltransferase
MIFDDIGSYPLPFGITRDWIHEAFDHPSERLYEIIIDAMRQKIDSGLEIPTYPQFQDMNYQFLRLIMGDEPFVIKDERIAELEIIEKVAKEYYEGKGRLKVRICVTGPVELCHKGFGNLIFGDVLEKFARCIRKIIRNSIEGTKYIEVFTICIDEPSIGTNPDMVVDEEDLIKALEISSSFSKCDMEIHLHSPIFYETVCNVDGIGIIGIESAANPSLLNLIDEDELELKDKFLRVGVSRTDIDGMAAEFTQKYGKDVWKEENGIKDMIDIFESKNVIKKRMERAYKIFGDRIRYAGPDCGLGSWPSQESAFQLLKNTGIGLISFKNEKKRR